MGRIRSQPSRAKMSVPQTNPFAIDRALLQAGTVLFLLGLLTGLAVPALAIPRMALSSHLEGLFNGMVLIALGLMWPRLDLSKRLQWLTFGLATYAAYTNWLATLISSATGAAAMMPLAGGGKTGDTIMEAIVAFMLVSLSLAMIAAFGLVLWGLRRRA
jgi:hydroxylaminobenzene mutase